MIEYTRYRVNDYCGWGHTMFIHNKSVIEFKILQELAIGVKSAQLCYWLVTDMAFRGNDTDIRRIEEVLKNSRDSYWHGEFDRFFKGKNSRDSYWHGEFDRFFKG